MRLRETIRVSAVVGVAVIVALLFCAQVQAEGDSGPLRLEELNKGNVPKPTEPAESQPSKPLQIPGVGPTDQNPQTQPANKAKPIPAIPVVAPMPSGGLSEEELRRRLREDPDVPITKPKGSRYRRQSVARTTLPLEGSALLNRVGRIARDPQTGWWVATFENEPKASYEVPRRLLQCKLLEAVEKHLAKAPDTRFLIYGENTMYGKRSYMLLRRVMVVEDAVPAKPAEEPTTKPADESSESGDEITESTEEVTKSDDGATTQPAEPAGTDLDKAVTDRLMEEMLKDSTGRAIREDITPERTAKENIKSVAPAGKTPFNPGKKSIVIDRTMRIVKSEDGRRWEARFLGDNTLREPPLRVLPSQKLMRAVQLMKIVGNSDIRLKISGEITYYKGKRYLLIRKLMPQRDMNQF